MRKANCVIWELLAVCIIGFCAISQFVANHEVDGFDILITSWVQGIRTDILIQISNILAAVGAPKTEMHIAIVVAVLGMGIIFLFRQQRFKDLAPQFIVFGAANIAAFYVNYWLKNLFHRSRPLDHIASYSYPSGHAMVSFTFYITAAYFLWQNIPSKAGRLIIAVVCCMMTVLIGLSRVYLNMHYPSDIIGAYFAGGGITLIIILLFRWHRRRSGNNLSEN